MNTRSVLILSLWVLATPFEAYAQEKGLITFYGGYSRAVADYDESRGWQVSLAGNVTRHFALVADASGHANKSSTNFNAYGYFINGTYAYGTYASRKEFRDFNLLFGPRYAHTIGNRVTPFTHFLYGLEHVSRQYTATFESAAVSNERNFVNKWAFLLGGGVDIKVNNRLSVRALQLDLLAFKDQGQAFGWDGYVRASFGAVYRLSKSAKS
jgi:hypothetical protein